MSNSGLKISEWCKQVYRAWRDEFQAVFSDAGVLLFFLLLPTVYPIVYSLIYNKELVRDVSVVVVDDSRGELSREFTRKLDATQNVAIIGYAADMEEARKAMHEKACYAILHIPGDFDKQIGRKEQADVVMYCDMSLLFRCREMLVGITLASDEMSADVRSRTEGTMLSGDIMPSYSFALGNTEEGMASFLLPGILIVILQQSLVLGIMMLGARRREQCDTASWNSSCMVGKAFCYFTIYMVLTVYLLHFVPRIFMFPQFGDVWQIFMFVIPFLFASIFFGMALTPLAREREDVFVIFVFTSILMLFLSGLTWPRYAMSALWKIVGSVLPSTWGIEGFIRMTGNGASLSDVSTEYIALWLLVAVYSIVAYIVNRKRESR